MPNSPHMGPGIAVSPSGIPISPSPEERKEIDKERSHLSASKRLWSAAHGSEMQIQAFIAEVRGEDPKPNNNQLLSRLQKEPFPGMKLAMKAGADKDWRNPEWDGATLLIKSVRTEALPIAMYMMALGADHTAVDNSGRGVLHWAAVEGNADFMEYLLDNLPDQYGQTAANLPDDGGDTPLHLAAYHGHLHVARLLVRAGDKNLTSTVNVGGHTASDLAEAARMWYVVTYLEEPSQQDEDRAPTPEGKPEVHKLRNLCRPCDKTRADEVREEWKDRPKPKAKADPKKKK